MRPGEPVRRVPGTTGRQGIDRSKWHPRFAIEGVLAELQAPYVDPSLPGLGVDITVIAMIAARLALQTIARGVGRSAELGVEEDHLLWTNRGGWIFDRPLQATAEHFARDPACPVCGEPPGDDPSEAVDDLEPERA